MLLSVLLHFRSAAAYPRFLAGYLSGFAYCLHLFIFDILDVQHAAATMTVGVGNEN